MEILKCIFIKIKQRRLSVLLMGIIVILLMKECNHVPIILPGSHTHSTDTIIKIKYVPKIIKGDNVPVEVIVYKDRDPILRDSLEKQPIIENVIFKKDEVDITTIDTTGRVETDVHKIESDSKELVIDNTGRVEEKKKTKAGRIIKKIWKGTKTGLIIVGAGTLVILGAKYL